MTLDFTLDKYRELCCVINKSDYFLFTLEDYLMTKNLPEKFIILRHDVDDEPEYSLEMAQIENMFKIKSTYYFRTNENVFKPDVMKKICNLGHEIGYHYEVLDEAFGNHQIAIEIFRKKLDKFKQIYDVKTIAQHGSPLIGNLNATSIVGIYKIFKCLLRGDKVFTNWVNADIWKFYSFENFGIKGEAYISIDFNDVFYISDSSMSWNNPYRMKDIVSGFNQNFRIKKTDDLIKMIKRGEVNHIYLLVHPDQWRNNLSDLIKWSILKHVRIAGKRGLKWYTRNIHKSRIKS